MSEIVIKKKPKTRRTNRVSVAVPPETYIKLYNLSHETGESIIDLTVLLLEDALQRVKLVEG